MLAVTVLPGILEKMLTQWPNLHVQITDAVEDALETALTHNTIDVAIAGRIPESAEIMQVAEARFSDRYTVISATNHPLQQRKTLSLKDVIDGAVGDAIDRCGTAASVQRAAVEAGLCPAACRRGIALAGRDQGDGGADELSGMAAGTVVRDGAAGGIDQAAAR